MKMWQRPSFFWGWGLRKNLGHHSWSHCMDHHLTPTMYNSMWALCTNPMLKTVDNKSFPLIFQMDLGNEAQKKLICYMTQMTCLVWTADCDLPGMRSLPLVYEVEVGCWFNPKWVISFSCIMPPPTFIQLFGVTLLIIVTVYMNSGQGLSL